MTREFLQDELKLKVKLPPEAVEAILAESARELDDLAFEHLLREEIFAAKGRNEKAVAALLDTEALKKRKNGRREAVAAALEALKNECGYLFETEADMNAPPPYAACAGFGPGFGEGDPAIAAMRAAAGVKRK